MREEEREKGRERDREDGREREKDRLIFSLLVHFTNGYNVPNPGYAGSC